MEEQQHSAAGGSHVERWHGRVSMEINAPIATVWAISSDFCGLKNWIPTIEFCEKIEGEYQTPGCVRYAGGSTFQRTDGLKSWATERLLSIDHTNFCFSYVMEDGNMELNGYMAQFQLSQGTNLDTTLVNWSFEMDPSSCCSRTSSFSKDETIAKQIRFLSGAVERLQLAATHSISLNSHSLSS